MTSAEQKTTAVNFLENFNHADPKVFDELITDGFDFEIVSGLKEFPPIHGRQAFVDAEVSTLRRLFPNGLNLTLDSVVSDGPHVAVQAVCDTIAANGRRYAQRYHFYLRFEGDKIARVREYNDTNLIREVFLT
jgi:ketosteroid isomerase-like protein